MWRVLGRRDADLGCENGAPAHGPNVETCGNGVQRRTAIQSENRAFVINVALFRLQQALYLGVGLILVRVGFILVLLLDLVSAASVRRERCGAASRAFPLQRILLFYEDQDNSNRNEDKFLATDANK